MRHISEELQNARENFRIFTNLNNLYVNCTLICYTLATFSFKPVGTADEITQA